MAAERLVDVITTGGGDYTSLAAAEDAEDATGDLVARNEYIRFRCAGSTADTTPVAIDGWTTNESVNYIQVEAADNHGGKWNTGVWRLETSANANSLVTTEIGTRFIGLQAYAIFNGDTATGNVYCYAFYTLDATYSCYIDRCIGKFSCSGATTYSPILLGFIGSKGRARNCTFYDATQGYGVWVLSAVAATVENVTIVDSFAGVYNDDAGGASTSAVNVGVVRATAPFTGTGISQTTCSSSTPTFVNDASDDFHLARADTTWRNAGTDKSSDYSEDIDGVIVGARNDIGADEDVAYSRDIADPIGLTDGRFIESVYNRLFEEGLGITDFPYRVQAHNRTAADDVGMTDEIFVSLFVLITRMVADSIGITDSAARVRDSVRFLSDNLDLADSAVKVSGHFREATDTLGVSDSVHRTLDMIRRLAESLGVSDSVIAEVAAQGIAYTRIITEALGITDARSQATAVIAWLMVYLSMQRLLRVSVTDPFCSVSVTQPFVTLEAYKL